ncbi:MAG: DNA adenine methylase [Prevotella sp.]|nr:DNA adenine methylase [Prevotella sp.]
MRLQRLQEQQLSLFPPEEINAVATKRQVVNVASVPKRSPFRYPGGKTWLVPTARKWFAKAWAGTCLIEPFAGGGIISLTAAAEHYFERVMMVELDDDVAAVWQTILDENCQWLAEQISKFNVTAEDISNAISHAEDGVKERAFATIVRNRTNHGGILAKGSGTIKTGEKGHGLSSRWYPATLVKRIREINKMADRISFVHGDAFDIMEQSLDDENAFFFIDPPYTVAGRRLYNHFEVDHRRIFELATKMRGQFLLTYDDTQEIRDWAEEYGLAYMAIPMQTTHLVTKEELLISNNLEWYSGKTCNQVRYFAKSKVV